MPAIMNRTTGTTTPETAPPPTIDPELIAILVTCIVVTIGLLTGLALYIYRKRGGLCPLFSRRSREQQNGRHISILNVNPTPENGQPFWDGHIDPQYLTTSDSPANQIAFNNRRTSSQLTLRSRLSLNLQPIPLEDITQRFSVRTSSTHQDYIVPSEYVLGRGSQATTINIMLDEPEQAPTPGPGLLRFPFEEAGAPGNPRNTTSVIEQVRVYEDIIEEVYTVEDLIEEVVEDVQRRDHNSYVVFMYNEGNGHD